MGRGGLGPLDGVDMGRIIVMHPQTPQERLARLVVDAVRDGGVIAYPTDSCYALGCRLGDKAAMDRVLEIRRIDLKHHLTLMCADLSQLGLYAKVDNSSFRMLKAATPGPFTFILPATKEVPARTLHPKRKTIGLRVPDNKICQALLRELGEPLLSCTLLLPDAETQPRGAQEILEAEGKRIDVVVDGGPCLSEPTTVVDLTDGATIVRRGLGNPADLGL